MGGRKTSHQSNNMAYKKEYTGFKALIVLLTFIATIYFSFSAVNHLIHWIVSAFESHDIRLIATIFLWLFSFATVLTASIWIGIGVATLVAKIFDL